MRASVAVVILNYNGEKFLERFLPGVINNSEGAEIIVADNASTDGSIELLRKTFPSVKIIENPSNEGYAGGYNLALGKVHSDYFILLNSDVEVTPGWITPVIEFMEQDKRVAACQPKIKSFDSRDYFEYAGAAGGWIDTLGYPFCRGRVFDTIEKDTGQYQSTDIFWASGACMFVQAEAFHRCNGFDSSFFAHMEEIDLCWRLQNAGYRISYFPGSTVYHVGGGTLQKSNSYKTFLNFRNNLRMLKKNMTSSEFIPVLFIRTFLDLVMAAKNILTLNSGTAFAVLKAHADLYIHWGRVKKSSAPPAKDFKTLNGVLKGSIVWNYFIRGKRKFSELVNS